MATYVLVGGAWIGAWAWRDVARSLRAHGHDVHPVTLTGLGDRVHLGRPETDLDTHITDVLHVMAYADLRDVVLVGHSYSGMVVTGVAERAPDRLAALVYLDTGPLHPGQALIDFSPPDDRERMRRLVHERGDGWRLPPPPFDELGTPAAMAGLTDAHRALWETHAVPQPFRTWTQPLDYAPRERPPYRRAVVVAGGFDLTAPRLREQVTAGAPPWAELFGAPDWEFEELATGHWPMLSTPEECAALLERLGGVR